jgi:CheY-like chemotaxis protein
VLVIEDEPALRDVLLDFLEDEGYDVDGAEHGQDGLSKAEARLPDAIVLDLMMPVMDGWAFLRSRSRVTNLEPVPVVVLSAVAQSAITEVKEIGARAVLSKPFELEALASVLRHFTSDEMAPEAKHTAVTSDEVDASPTT